MAGKQWLTVYPGLDVVDHHGSKRATYEFVDALRSNWQAGIRDGGPVVEVMVDKGRGWELYERLNFAEEG
jgi:hypothetical protein